MCIRVQAPFLLESGSEKTGERRRVTSSQLLKARLINKAVGSSGQTPRITFYCYDTAASELPTACGQPGPKVECWGASWGGLGNGGRRWAAIAGGWKRNQDPSPP